MENPIARYFLNSPYFPSSSSELPAAVKLQCRHPLPSITTASTLNSHSIFYIAQQFRTTEG